MAIRREQVEHVARLARLALTEDEISAFTAQLSRILAHMEVLGRVDTAEVPPTYHVLPLQNILRRDDVQESLPVTQVLQNAPDHDAGYFRVPKVVE